jgi:hypothetical protein
MVPDPSERLVKWINSGNLHCRAQKQEMRNQTRRLLKMTTSSSVLDHSTCTADDNESIKTNRTSQWECLQEVGSLELCSLGSSLVQSNNRTSSQWECMPEGGSIELCSLGSPVQSDEGAVTHSSSVDNTVFIFDCPDGALFNEKVAARSWTRAS